MLFQQGDGTCGNGKRRGQTCPPCSQTAESGIWLVGKVYITSIENGEVEKIKISSTGSQATVKMKDSFFEKEVSIQSLDSFMTYSQYYLKTGAFSLEEEKESIWITALGFITPFGLQAIY